MIAAGANVNAATVKGFTPHFVASGCGHADVCVALLAAGANATAVRVGSHEFLLAVSQISTDPKFLPVRRLLVAYGAPAALLPKNGFATQLPKCYAL